MQAVILAAGLGKRMGDLTKDTPKPMLKVGERTLLEHKLEVLPDEISEIILVVGYLREAIENAIGQNFRGKSVRYVFQAELKGTGHALFICRDVVRGKFLVLNGDDLYHQDDLSELVRYPLSLLAWEVPADDSAGKNATIKTGREHELEAIIENQPTRQGDLINAGAYVLDDRIFKYALVPKSPGSSELGLPQTLVQMVRDGVKIKIVKARWWRAITKPEDLSLKQ